MSDPNDVLFELPGFRVLTTPAIGRRSLSESPTLSVKTV